MFTVAQMVEVLPVIASLVVIEGLLSVDNALVIAALASPLPKAQQATALRLGLGGAYLFRGVALFLVGLIIANPWLKLVGAVYLIYLMASNLATPGRHGGGSAGTAAGARPRGLLRTVLQIEVMDLALSLDNVVAAVALDQRLWVVCTGVFIGILTLRYLAGWCIRLITRLPVLKPAAFLLIGFVGVILLVEIVSEWHGRPVHIGSVGKFLGIIVILAVALLYGRFAAARAVLGPVVASGAIGMTALDRVFSVVLWPLKFPVSRWKRRP